MLLRRAPFLLPGALALLLGISICYAIIALRRHVSIDLAAGLAVGVAGGMLAKMQVFWAARRAISTETAS